MKHKLGGFSGFIIGLLYTIVIVGLNGTIIYDGLRIFQFFILSLIIYGVVYLVSLSRTVSRILVTGSAAAIIITAVLCLLQKSILKAVLKEAEGVFTLWQNIAFNMPTNVDSIQYDETSMIVIALIASIAVLFLLNKINSFYILSGVVFTLFIFSWFMTGIESKLLFLLFCVLTVLSYISKVYRQKQKLGLASADFSVGSMLLLNIPLIIIPLAIILFIPKSEHPIQWPWLDAKINSVFTYFEQRFNYIELENFSLSSIGFSNEKTKRLGGAVNPSDIEVLKVKTQNRTYLRGAVYYWYEDSTWTRSNVLANNVNDQEVNETRMGWSDIPVEVMFPEATDDDKLFLQSLKNGELATLLFPSYSVEVEIRNMITNNIFVPLKSIMPVKHGNGDTMPIYELDGGVILCDNRLKRGDRYQLSYIQPMYGEALLKKALNFSGDLYTNALNKLTDKKTQIERENMVSSISTSSTITFDEDIQEELDLLGQKIQRLTALRNKSKEINSIYTLLPENMPGRVADLARKITQDLKTNYEKTVAIEKYLRENHTYTLSPENVPLDKDFVDYFLFEKNEGYCTYYATSMVILLRTLGIPSRYVEGYVLPPEKTSDNVFTVTNNNAHAWVEVYFEGFGWLIFEPTPAFAGVMDYKTVSWSVSEGSDMSYYDMMEQYRQRNSSNDYVPVDFIPSIEAESYNYISLTLFIAGCAVLGCVLINLLVIIIQEISLKRNKKEKIILLRFNNMINWLALAGYKIKPGESAREFAERIDMDYYLSYPFKEITEIFSKVRYGNQSVINEEADRVKSIYNTLKRKILKEIGIKRYLPLRRLFFGI